MIGNRLGRCRYVAVVLALSLLLCGCGTTMEKQKTTTLHICYSGVYVSAASMIVQKKDLISKYLPDNVEVEWSCISTGPDLRDAIVSGNVDIADMSLMTFITGYENGLPLTLICYSGSTPIKLYSHSSEIASIHDFGDTDRISITNKNTNLHMAFMALSKRELGSAIALDNALSAIPAADALASLETSDDYQGAVFSFPMSTKADKNENLVQIDEMNELIQSYGIGCVMVSRTDYYENNRELIEAFKKAQQEAMEFIINCPEEAAGILAENFKCTEEDVINAISEMPPTNKVVGYDKQSELLYEAGILNQKPALFEDLWNYDEITK